jgi:sulfur-oxidizing protein SoxX
MHMKPTRHVCLLLLASTVSPPQPVTAAEPTAAQQPYQHWHAENYAIEQPLGGLVGVPERGRAIAGDQHRGNCLACHELPIPEENFYGNLGPPLAGIGSRQSVGMIRLHVVDQSRFNPETVMPGFYRAPQQLNRVAPSLRGTTWLTAQEVEDVVAWLATLK